MVSYIYVVFDGVNGMYELNETITIAQQPGRLPEDRFLVRTLHAIFSQSK